MTIHNPFKPFYGGLFKPELAGGYRILESLVTLKGYQNMRHFLTHHLVVFNFDDKGIFYNVEKRNSGLTTKSLTVYLYSVTKTNKTRGVY